MEGLMSLIKTLVLTSPFQYNSLHKFLVNSSCPGGHLDGRWKWMDRDVDILYIERPLDLAS